MSASGKDYLASTSVVHDIDNWCEQRDGDWHQDSPDSQRYFTPTVQDTFLSLPGTGAPGSECRDPVPFHCRACGEIFFVPHDCGERQCPHCSHIWVRDQARRMKGRLWDGRTYWTSQDAPRSRLHHCIVSLRMELPKDRGEYRHLRKFVIGLARQAGLKGGCLVFHPWRESRDGEYDVIGPHFHIFGLAPWVRPGTEIEPYNDDILFRRVPDFDARQIDPFEYVLTHCGLTKGCHAVVWFGCLAYNKMQRGREEQAALDKRDPPPETCPTCGSTDTYYVDTHVRPGVPWDREEPTF